jgi:hypothetical protein
MSGIRRNPMYRYLIVLSIGSMLGMQTWRILFNNFAVEVARLEGSQIGIVQSFREVPGILALSAVLFLLLIKEHRLSALAILTTGVGLAVTGFFPSFIGLLLTTLAMSIGFHFFQVTGPSLTLQYFDKKDAPWVIGKIRSFSAASSVVVAILIYFTEPVLNFIQLYVLVGAIIMAAGIWGLLQDPSDKNVTLQHKKLFIRKKYWLYYLLRFMAGTRRQTFIAFALFLLVKNFNLTVQTITILFSINNIINFFLSPTIGQSLARFGERLVLTLEATCLMIIFSAFALVQLKIMLIILYMLGSIIFYNVPPIAIRTYFHKVADPRDIAGTIATGSTINHIATTIAPALAGFMWMFDYRIPFVFGAVLSLASFFAAQLIRIKTPDEMIPSSG